MSLNKKILAETLGTAGLLIVVVGSGIMGESLSQGNSAIALLANSIATGAGLYALILTFSATSGSHFNPVVSLVAWWTHNLKTNELIGYVLGQVVGALIGVMATHAMFGKLIFQFSNRDRGELRFVFSEMIATFGLILVIQLTNKNKPETTPVAVSLFITSAYWCTSSTSFANPAVTIARSFTDTFSGILCTGAPFFIFAQMVGGAVAFAVAKYLDSSIRPVN